MKQTMEGELLMNIRRLMVLLFTIISCMLLILNMSGENAKAAAPGSISLKKEFYSNILQRTVENDNDIDYLVNLAKSFNGVRYEYGGDAPEAFDCSGFTMYIMNQFNISLPHSASGQSECGNSVAENDLMPGDLVFFATSGGRGITHVGLYLGDKSFIHAASNGVSINNLDENYYKRCYITAVRLIE